ncbi:MAG: motility associated factor glycosyltransferase family protein, partial [Gammaproteobacteria bacterium]|nr:motility associated factor glycosyltransferase family protein [Gammaproteobacteria bacterium]
KNLVYEYHSEREVIDEIRSGIGHVGMGMSIGGVALDFEENDAVNIDPIQKNMRRKLYERGPYGAAKLAEQVGGAVPALISDYIPYMRVYGIGLGLHIQELIRMKNITFISIYEPHIDLFYSSLYTISWEMIFKYFSIKQRQFTSNKFHINLYLGNSPENVIEQNKGYQAEVCRYMVLAQGRYAHFAKEERIKRLIQLEQRADHEMVNNATNGWYEDQRAGFYFAARNIKRHHPLFSGARVERFLRLFVVGNGPSLDGGIEFIKQNRENAIILSCGSAFATLLTEGIVPDYQILQERDWHLTDYEKEFDADLLKQITLMKLNVISPMVDHYYKDVLVFQKYNDPGSALLGEEYAVTTNVNPTVTNAGVAIAAALGAEEVYLFGLDYGAPKSATSMHASKSIYKTLDLGDAVESEIEVPGALGEDVVTTKFFAWSLHVTEDKISRHPDIRWINVGDGALIKGTESVRVEDIHSFSRKINRQRVMSDIGDCFNADYDSQAMVDRLSESALQMVGDYFDAVLSFASSTPQTREQVLMVVTLMDRAMVQHKIVGGGTGVLHYYPGFLLSGGVQELAGNIFSQAIYSNDDQAAADLFVVAMDVLREYRDEIMEDMRTLVGHIAADEEVEIKLSY